MQFFDFHHHSATVPGIYNLALMETAPHRLFSAGIHPKDAGEGLDEKFRWLEEVAASKWCVALGECGLDALVGIPDDQQEAVFLRQLQLAEKLHKPVIIHCVRRFHRLSYFKNKSDVPMIIHGFNKNINVGEDLLRCGFSFSFGKSLLYSVNLQHFLQMMPPEKIFLETDSAAISVEPLYILAAKLKDMSVATLQEQIKKNLLALNINP